MTMTPGQVDGLWLWVRRWLERPIPTWKARQHIGQAWVGAVVDWRQDTCEDFATPGCAVGSELLPIANVDIQVLEGRPDAVFVAFLLPSDWSIAFPQFSVLASRFILYIVHEWQCSLIEDISSNAFV